MKQKIKKGISATVNKQEMPTMLAAELSDYHAFNPGRITGITGDRIQLTWMDGHKAWFDACAIIPLF